MKKISVIAVFGLLCSLFSGCGFTVRFGKEGFDKNYSVGSFEYNSGEIRNVKIEWVSGSVKIVESDSDRLKVTETDKGLSEAQKMRWCIDGQTLKIRFCKPGYAGSFPFGTKILTVEVPKGTGIFASSASAEITLKAENPKSVELRSVSGSIKSDRFSSEEVFISSTSGSVTADGAFSENGIEIHTTSGEISAEKLCASKELSVKSTSGLIDIDYAEASKAKFENISGKIEIKKAVFPEFSIKTTSGSIFAGILSCESANINSGSGDVRIELLEKLGATVRYKSTSGRFEHGDCRLSGEEYVFGNGTCRIEVKTTSGGLKIE